jgi:F0F1-type ATP synthase assembly protein I
MLASHLRVACPTPVWYSKKEMKQAAEHTTTNSGSGKAPFTAGIIGLTFLDTTWRIVTPVLLFTILGIIADRTLGTKPWLTIVVAVPVGFLFAALLIKRQLEAVERSEEEAKRK